MACKTGFIAAVFLLALCVYVAAQETNEKVITTEYGQIRGRKFFTLFDNKPYYSFRGVPYAQPPLKSLRFKPPQPPIPWIDVKNAFNYGNDCLQIARNNLSIGIVGNEDCLYLNVFVPGKFLIE